MDIDPIQYGQIIAKVDTLEKEVSEIKADLKTLLELANRSKGGFWVGMTIASIFGGVIHFFAERMIK
jgi:uncharacterized protein (UPF0335 family)